MKEEKFSEMLNKYKKTVQISFEEYKEKTKEDSKEVFQYMVYKMANDDIKIFEKLEIKDKEIDRLNNIIDELEDLITIKISRASNEEDYDIEIDDMIELKDKLNELKENNIC